MSAPTVTTSGFVSRVEYKGQTVFVRTHEVIAKIDTMKGIQRHRGYVGLLTTATTRETCGHRLHTKARAARACGIAEAKRMVRNMAQVSS